MTAITVDEAKENLERIINEVLQKDEPAIFRTASGEQVVMLPLEEFNSWQETIYLLSNPANATRLQNSIEQVRRGEVTEKELIDA
jgi:antitoxin YefM